MSAAKAHSSKIHLPKGWAEASLGMVVRSSSAKAEPSENQKARYVGLEHIKSGESQLGGSGTGSDVRSTKNKFIRGDILYGKLRPYLDKVALPDFEGICSTDILVLRPEEGIERGFIEAVLRSDKFIEFATKSSSGINLPRTNFEKIAPFEFGLAPSKEQKRIAAKLNGLLTHERNLRHQLNELPALIQQYRAAVLEAACSGRLVPTEAELARKERRDFEPASVLLERILNERRAKWEADQLAKMRAAGKEPKDDDWRDKYPIPAEPSCHADAHLPRGWVWASLEQLTDPTRVICYGILMPKANVEDGVLYVKVRDMRKDTIDLSSLQRTSPKIAAQYERASLKAGDVLLAIRGTYGRVAEVPKALEGGNITQDTARLAISASTLSALVMWQLRAPRMQKYFQSVARGVAVKGVNIGDVRPAAIALPPIAEQKRIVVDIESRLATFEHIETQISAALEFAVKLRFSMFHRALSGKLVDQRRSDEPAKELLARICIERDKRLQDLQFTRTKRRAIMIKLSPEVVKEVISKLPKDRFSFEDLIAALQVEYDPLKDIVFELLGETKPTLRQIFDSKVKAMQLERIKT